MAVIIILVAAYLIVAAIMYRAEQPRRNKNERNDEYSPYD